MLTYTNRLKKLVLPEYGRNIQNMVDRCAEIEDRQERTRAVSTVVATIMTLFPPTGDREEYERKIWDHVMIMSGFKLDVDLPFKPVDPAVFEVKPSPLPMPEMPDGKYRQYGALIRQSVSVASNMPEGPERDEMVVLIANQMKKMLVEQSGESIDDDRIFSDLRMMSRGTFNLKPENVVLCDYAPSPKATSKKKKKK